MMTFDPGAGEPEQWYVCFCRRAALPALRFLPGRHKHVRAFGCVPLIGTWVFIDPALDRTVVLLARGDKVRSLIAAWLADSTVVLMPRVSRETMLPRIGGWCVPQIKHLIGLSSGALLPDALLRDCLRHGGSVVRDGSSKLQPAAA